MAKKTDGRKNNGGKREGAGRPSNGYVSMQVQILPDDKAKVKAKHGRKFNGIFRQWVKTIID